MTDLPENKDQHQLPPGPDADICVAAATPPGVSGLAVIRMSGNGAGLLADPLFRPAGARFAKPSQMAGYTCAFGQLIDPDSQTLIDQVVLTRFAAPHSYTGEEGIEISCHGGPAVKQAILDLLLRQGARAAQPGEFTRRAFLNGKLDLAQAEAVMDLISADAARSARNAAAQLNGRLSELVRREAQSLYPLLARVELILEYPEHDELESAQDSLVQDLRSSAARLRQRADSYEQGRILREGLTVVLAGQPNAGKSSLLNALAGYERAIVTAIPGTTRDTVEERVDIRGIPVRLIDTAGLRETHDPIEQLGVARTRQALRQADLVFWLLSPPLDDVDAELKQMRQSGCEHLVPLVSKEDLAASAELVARIRSSRPSGPLLTCSVLTGEGIEQIRDEIVRVYESRGAAQAQDVLVSNSRQRVCLEKASEQLEAAQEALTSGLTLDVVASLLRGALDALAELTGENVSEELIDTIFSRFCVGK